MPPLKSSSPQLKKPRHRHSPAQLAGLNELYEQTEHPTLAQRTSLALALGLELKSVNAYFQNKRASAKKQPRGSPYDAPRRPGPAPIDDDYYYPPPQDHNQYFRSQAPVDLDPRLRDQSSVSTDHTKFLHPDVSIDDIRLSQYQVDELERIYRINRHPTLDESRVIAERIGVHHQAIVEWFRSRQRLERRSGTASAAEYPPNSPSISPLSADANERRPHPYQLPPITTLPPISSLPPASSHPSLGGADIISRRLSAVPEDQYYLSRTRQRSSSPRNPAAAAPYSTPSGNNTPSSTSLSSTRQRRGRPDPLQLNSLRRLLSKTPTPSIEERSALAAEIGMDVGKVTNWFRNLRQSARKRARQVDNNDDSDLRRRRHHHHHREVHSGGEEDDNNSYYGDPGDPVYLSETSLSRSETPPWMYHPSATAAASGRGGLHDHDHDNRGGAHHNHHQHIMMMHSSDDEESRSSESQEAVTPASSPRGRPPDLLHMVDMVDVAMDEKATSAAVAQFAGRVPYEDALLLLTFHRSARVF